MAAVAPRSSDTVLPSAGALIAASGLAAAAAFVGTGGRPALLPLSDVGLALGVGILVFGRSGIVGPSWPARGALLLFGVAPLIDDLEPAPTPWSVLLGMITLAVVTIATVASAVLVARTGRVRGVARWALLVVAADAVLTAVMSTVQIDGLAFAYLGGHLELVRPLALLVWGVALVLQWTAVRRRAATALADWKRTTDVSGAAHPDQVAVPEASGVGSD
jgi:hypothetical protein